jgi:CHAT domain-containing protein
MFTEEFFRHYREGKSAAKASQAAAIALIENKAITPHEPYFWASFSLIGDYR